VSTKPSTSGKPGSASWGTAAIGIEFTAAFGGLAIIGYLIDRSQGTQPFWTISLALLGLVGGSYNLYKEVKKLQSQKFTRSVRKDSGEIDPKAASAEVAARRGRPRPTGRVNLFDQQDINLEELDEVEMDWPESERDQIEDDLRKARESQQDFPEDEDETR